MKNRPRRTGKQKPATNTVVQPTFDTAQELKHEVDVIFFAYIIRMTVTLLLCLIMSLVIVKVFKLAHLQVVWVVFMSLLLGIVFTFRRGVQPVFTRLLALAKARMQLKRYGDVIYILKNFHNFGNQQFDKDGEAHFLLMMAYKEAGEPEKADAMRKWIIRGRPKSRYATQLRNDATL